MSDSVAWLRQLRQQLSSDSLLVQSREGVRLYNVEGRGRLWVVGRDCCTFRTVEIGNVPASKIDAVVRSQVTAISPFKIPGSWHYVQGGRATVWMWDEQERLAKAAALDFDVSDYVVLPESCFAEQSVGVQLVESLAGGVFAQYRKGEELLAESWWPGPPSTLEWRSFLRGSGQPFAVPPQPTSLAVDQLSAWPGIRTQGLASRSIESLLMFATVAVFVFLLSFQLMGSARLWLAVNASQQQTETVTESNQSVIGLRDEALMLRDTVRVLNQLKKTGQLQLMERIADNLPASAGRLIVWRLQGASLEFIVEDQAPDLEAYVSRLQDVPTLSQIGVEPLTRTGEVKILATVTP